MKKYQNKNGAIIKIIKEEENYITYSIDEMAPRCVNKENFYNIIKLNFYEEI